jgi:hypothetical protein
MTHDEHFQSSSSYGEPVRCSFCGALLATTGPAGLRIRRGQLEALIDGPFRAVIVCYQQECRRLNVIKMSPLALSNRDSTL